MSGKIKVMLIFGTRPEAIKMCPVVLELKKRADKFDTIVCVTAQHRQMLDQVLEVFGVTPDYDLNIMKPGQSLEDITVNVLKGVGSVLDEVKPDIVLVHGDTSTTFVSSLAAYYRQVRIGHVEAGLRTYNKYSPYPEEMNRQLTGVMTDIHFSPTELAKENLLKENKDAGTIFVTGNTAIDALKTTTSGEYKNELLDWADGSRLILMTAHRRENLGEAMRGFFRSVLRIVNEFPDVKVIYPVHLNPAVQNAANDILKGHDRIKLISPLDVIDFHNFIKRSYLILTDSGGIQEEAPSFGKPVLVLRDTTERPEGVTAGTLKLAGTDENVIYSLIRELLTDKAEYDKMSRAKNPYGDGHASERIADILEKYFSDIG